MGSAEVTTSGVCFAKQRRNQRPSKGRPHHCDVAQHSKQVHTEHVAGGSDRARISRLYDFVYLPMDFRNGVNLGYAFVNLITNEDALHFMQVFQGFSKWFVDSVKVCEVSWAHPHQGRHQHVERYRNSPVMHPSMPDDYKPMVFKKGMRVPFPPPTKVI